MRRGTARTSRKAKPVTVSSVIEERERNSVLEVLRSPHRGPQRKLRRDCRSSTMLAGIDWPEDRWWLSPPRRKFQNARASYSYVSCDGAAARETK